MSKLHAVFAMLTLTLSLGAAACDDSDDNCSGDTQCRVDTPPVVQKPPKEDLPDRCAAACANLLGACDGSAQIVADDSELTTCEGSCPANFSDDEIDCLAALACDESSDACLP
jgi:hypothetical protein